MGSLITAYELTVDCRYRWNKDLQANNRGKCEVCPLSYIETPNTWRKIVFSVQLQIEKSMYRIAESILCLLCCSIQGKFVARWSRVDPKPDSWRLFAGNTGDCLEQLTHSRQDPISLVVTCSRGRNSGPPSLGHYSVVSEYYLGESPPV
jgi:hypothetical protein